MKVVGAAQLVGSMPNDSKTRDKLVQSQVQTKYDKMLHPPLTYLGDAFQYRAADGKFNSVLSPHLGQGKRFYYKYTRPEASLNDFLNTVVPCLWFLSYVMGLKSLTTFPLKERREAQMYAWFLQIFHEHDIWVLSESQ